MKNIYKSIAATAFVVLTAFPAAAQLEVRTGIQLPGVEIRVGRRAPPRLLNERRPQRPGRDFLWIRGSWDWQNEDWAWVPGRWDRPGDRGTRWVQARYVRQGPAWRYEPAHWSNQSLVEGEDYRRFRDENDRDRDHRRDHRRDRDRDRDGDRRNR